MTYKSADSRSQLYWVNKYKFNIPNFSINITFTLRQIRARLQIYYFSVVKLLNFEYTLLNIISDQISHSIVSDSLRPHESQHARPPCPSPTPGVHSDSRHRVSDTIQPSHPLLSLLLLPPIPPRIRVFSNESTLRMRWPKYWSFSFSIIPSKEIPGLISFRMDWLDFLAVNL